MLNYLGNYLDLDEHQHHGNKSRVVQELKTYQKPHRPLDKRFLYCLEGAMVFQKLGRQMDLLPPKQNYANKPQQSEDVLLNVCPI